MQNLDDIRDRLFQLVGRHNTKTLEEFGAKLDGTQVSSLIDCNFQSGKFKELLIILLNSIKSDTESNQHRRLLIANTVIKNLENVELTNSECNAIITLISSEITKLSGNSLLLLLLHFLDSLQNQKNNYPCFKDFIPFLLNEIPKKSRWIYFNEKKYQENDFKTAVINEVCLHNWKTEQITAIASMFYDIPMSKDDHLIVLRKFGQIIRYVSCQQLPSLFHQLMLFCHEQHFRFVFFCLEQYFNYFKYRENESTVIDSMNDAQKFDEKFQKELNEVEKSLLLYIYQQVKSYYLIFKDYLNTMKNFTKIPELIFSPFHVRVLLAISCAEPTNNCMSHEILRAALVRFLTERQKANKSLWFKNILFIDTHYVQNIENLFVKIINNYTNESELIIQGLLNFSLMLLELKQNMVFGQDQLIDQQYQLSIVLISFILKKKRTLAPEILKHLLNKMSCKTPQIINCIRELCLKNVVIMLEHHQMLIDAIQKIIIKDYDLTYSLIQAIMPVAEMCPTIRDTLIIVVRKLMLSRQFSTKEISLISLLKLLKNIKTKNLVQLSQQSSSSNSTNCSVSTSLSQLSNQFDCGTFSLTYSSSQNNESVVLEVLKVLNQCFLQHSNVRLKLYEGLLYISTLNEELAIIVLGMFWTHFSQFSDENFNLIFQKTIIFDSSNIIDFEPIGKFLLIVSIIMNYITLTNRTKQRFEKTIESIEKQLLNTNIKEFNSIDLQTISSSDNQNKQSIIILIQYITTLEALLANRLIKWLQSNNNGKEDELTNLLLDKLQHYQSFYQNKLTVKKKDKRSKSLANENNENNNKNSEEIKLLFNLPKTIIEFSIIEKLIKEMFSQKNRKFGKELKHFVLNVTYELILSQKSALNRRKQNCLYIISIAKIFYKHSIEENYTELLDSDFKSVLMILECINLSFQIIIQFYNKRFRYALKQIVSNNNNTNDKQYLMSIIEVMQKIFNNLKNDDNVDNESQKMPLVILSIIRLLVNQMNEIESSSDLFVKMYQWLDEYAEKNKTSNKVVVQIFAQFWFEMAIQSEETIEGQFFQVIACNLAKQFGTIDGCGVKVKVREYLLINEDSAMVLLQELCEVIKVKINDMLWLTSRFNMEYTMLSMTYLETDRKRECLTRKEQDLCTQLLHIILVIQILTNLKTKSINHCGIIMKSISNLYNILRMLTNYFTVQSTKSDLVFQNAKFDKVIRLVGKQLSKSVYLFVQFIDAFSNKTTKSGNEKKKTGSKSLRELFSIPKTLFLIEQFNKVVLKLSSKTKVDLSKDIDPGNYHGYRLDVEKLRDKSSDENPIIESDDVSLSENANDLIVENEEEIMDIDEIDLFDDDNINNIHLDTIEEDSNENQESCSVTNFDVNEKENYPDYHRLIKKIKIENDY